MHEKELRSALVCFSGISHAVYMHRVGKEILNLVRASRDLVLRAEEPHLPHVRSLIDELRAELVRK